MNVVVFGESGSGKSSLVNLLLGRDAAVVSDKAVGCTFEFQKYSTDTFNLFDTVGLSEGRMGTVAQSAAVKKLIDLLKSLEDGVSLLLFVMEKGRIKKTLDENYKLFVEAICMHKVPVALVITHCEMETIRGTWWKENMSSFESYGWKIDSVVSGCCMSPESVPPMMKSMIQTLNAETKAELLEVIENTMLVPGWKVKGGWKTWFVQVFSMIKKILSVFFPFFGGLFGEQQETENVPDLRQRLFNYFCKQGYDAETSRSLANDIANSI